MKKLFQPYPWASGVVALALMMGGPEARAVSIPVANGGFEEPDLGPQGNGATFSLNIGAPWEVVKHWDTGAITIENSEPFSPDAQEGTQFIAITNRGADHGLGEVTRVTQQIYDGGSTGLVAGATYTMTVWLRKLSAAVLDTDFVIGLYQDAAMATPYASLAGQDMTTPVSVDAWQQYTVQFTATGAEAGQSLYIGFQNHDPDSGTTNPSAPRLWVDNVQLSADNVPEPAGTGLLAVALAGLGARRRTRRG